MSLLLRLSSSFVLKSSNTICSETNCVLNEGINIQSDGSFLLKVGELILESGKYFAFAGESRHELYRDLTLEQKGQERSKLTNQTSF